MPTLLLRFPGRRYHATPWGHHVNEGQVEWPPSPWRLLRALISAGYTALGWQGVPAQGESLLEKLASVSPTYWLPAAAAAHSRHYMPLGKIDKGREKTTLVFDTWAQIDDGSVDVTWDVELTTEELSLLSELARSLGYLGRSESWVDAAIASSESRRQGTPCFPCEGREHPGPGWEQVALLAPEHPDVTRAWLAQRRDEATRSPARKKAKTAKAPGTDAGLGLAESPIGCLQLETSWLQRGGWSQPPGSRRVLYWRRTDSLEAGAPRPKYCSPPAEPVDAVLLSMATASRNPHALPSIARTLPQAELLHRALAAQGRTLGHVAYLSGTDSDGVPLEGHRHNHILHVDLDGDGHLDHVLLWAPQQLDGAAQKAIRAVRTTFTKGGVGDLSLAVAASGTLLELTSMRPPWGDAIARLAGPSLCWRSRTPFVPPRHMKPKGRNSLQGQIAAELCSRGMPPAASIEVLSPADNPSRKLRHFVRVRRHGPPPPVDCGFDVRITFSDSVRGPLCLGYGAHFGLGLFDVEVR